MAAQPAHWPNASLANRNSLQVVGLLRTENIPFTRWPIGKLPSARGCLRDKIGIRATSGS
jgi:hypothetical protein